MRVAGRQSTEVQDPAAAFLGFPTNQSPYKTPTLEATEPKSFKQSFLAARNPQFPKTLNRQILHLTGVHSGKDTDLLRAHWQVELHGGEPSSPRASVFLLLLRWLAEP